MPENATILRTTRFGTGRGAHDHVVYVRPDGSGYTGESNKHAHMVSVLMGQDGMSKPRILPALDGHTHDFGGEIQRKDPKETETEEERVKKVRELFKFASEYDEESRKNARESDDFYLGDQWKASHKETLESTNRTALTINLIQPAIDVLSGYQRQNRTDIKFFPVEEGDALAADIMTALVKNICEQNDFEYVETDVFTDQLIAGKGHFHAYIDRNENLQGDIKIENFAWEDVRLGPHEKRDGSDCGYLFKTKWYTKEKIKQMWPDKAEDIDKDFEELERDFVHQRFPGAQYERSTNESIPVGPTSEYLDIARAEYRVIECELREPRRVPVLVNELDMVTISAEGWAKADITSVKTIPGFRVVYSKVDRLKVMTIAGNVLLEESSEDSDQFSIITVYAKRRKGQWWGKVESAKDAQREVNKRHAQAVDIVNKMAAYGWFFSSRTFSNPAEKKLFKETSSSPGFAVEVETMAEVPAKVEGAKVPTEVIALEESAVNRMREIMSVNPEMLGAASTGQSQSGVAMVNRQRQGLLGNEFLFDNLALGKKLLGRRLISLVQQCYTPERILRVLANRNARSPVMVGDKTIDQYPVQELLSLLSNVDAKKFDLVVGESGHSPTQLMNNFLILLEMAKSGVAIPPDMMLLNAPMPKDMKDKAMAALQAQQKSAKEMQDAKMQTEMLKSMPDSVKLQVASQHGMGQGPQPPAPGQMPAQAGIPGGMMPQGAPPRAM